MTKRDIVIQIAVETGMTQAEVKEVVDRTFRKMYESLERGEKVELRTFGVFKIKTRGERKGRNPRTGEEVPIPSHKVVHFKAGKALRARVK